MGEKKRRRAAGMAPVPKTQPPRDTVGLLAEGRALQAQGRPQDAFARSRSALALEPHNADALHLMGIAAVAARLNTGVARPARHTPLPLPAPLLRAGPAMEADALAQACLERDLMLFDDVLADPMLARDHALGVCAREGERHARGNFPGVQTLGQPCQPLMQRIADALGRDIKWETPDNGAVRVSTASDVARCDIHVDSPTLVDVYAGVLYLSLPEHSRGGTSFWRRRATGWARRPDAHALQAAGYASSSTSSGATCR